MTLPCALHITAFATWQSGSANNCTKTKAFVTATFCVLPLLFTTAACRSAIEVAKGLISTVHNSLFSFFLYLFFFMNFLSYQFDYVLLTTFPFLLGFWLIVSPFFQLIIFNWLDFAVLLNYSKFFTTTCARNFRPPPPSPCGTSVRVVLAWVWFHNGYIIWKCDWCNAVAVITSIGSKLHWKKVVN